MDATATAAAPEPKGITCPRCGCAHLLTTHTRPAPGNRIRRHRACRNCGRKIVTTEHVEIKAPKARIRR